MTGRERAARTRTSTALRRIAVLSGERRAIIIRSARRDVCARVCRPLPSRPGSEGFDNKNSNVKALAPTGNSESYAHRRLRKDRPDIHARVLAGEISAHAGMIEAGFRKKPPSRNQTPLEKVRCLPRGRPRGCHASVTTRSVHGRFG